MMINRPLDSLRDRNHIIYEREAKNIKEAESRQSEDIR